MVERIKELCELRHTNFAKVEKALGFANASLKKTSEKTECGRVMAIANYFDVSMEYLITGTEPSPILELSHDEWMLIDGWRALNDDQREAIGTLMKTFLAQKRESDSQHEEKMA